MPHRNQKESAMGRVTGNRRRLATVGPDCAAKPATVGNQTQSDPEETPVLGSSRIQPFVPCRASLPPIVATCCSSRTGSTRGAQIRAGPSPSWPPVAGIAPKPLPPVAVQTLARGQRGFDQIMTCRLGMPPSEAEEWTAGVIVHYRTGMF